MYDLLWSDHLLSEVERVLVEYKGLTVERAPAIFANASAPHSLLAEWHRRSIFRS